MQRKMGCILLKFQAKKFDSALNKLNTNAESIRQSIEDAEVKLENITAAKNALGATIKSQNNKATKTQEARFLKLCKEERRQAQWLASLEKEYDGTASLSSTVKDSRLTVTQRLAVKDAIKGLPIANSSPIQDELIRLADKELDASDGLKETFEQVRGTVDARRDTQLDDEVEEEFRQLISGGVGTESDEADTKNEQELRDILHKTVVVPLAPAKNDKQPRPGSADTELVTDRKQPRNERKIPIVLEDMT